MNPKISGISRFRPHPAVGESLGAELVGYRSVNFKRVNEFTISDQYDNSAQTGFVLAPETESGPGSSQRTAVILGVAKRSLSEVVDYYSSTRAGFRRQEFRQAGAYYDSKGLLKAGMFPEDLAFGKLFKDDEPMCVVAMSQGSAKVYMTMGLVTVHRGMKARRQMLIPKNVEIIDKDVPAAELSSKYPGVPLI